MSFKLSDKLAYSTFYLKILQPPLVVTNRLTLFLTGLRKEHLKYRSY